ncbi:MAG: hypothetical protein LUQ65_06320 [Candidatus Helarchaeota archaeon]|nr:hypothetical protein [Candidatus Helarchaeota archaeon]
MNKKTSIFSIFFMSFLVVSVFAGLASQSTLAPYGNSNTLGNPGLNTAAWAANGNAITNVAYNQGDQQICSDGAGGAIIVWNDYRSNSYSDIYAQKINATGHVQWAANGVALCTAFEDQYFPQICTDGAGGAIVTWQDERDGASNDQIYAVRINSAGVVQWAADGIGVCTNSYEQLYPQICSDGSGGAVITWEDRRGGTGMDIYAQKIKSDGSASWKSNGIPVCNGTSWQRYPKICSDGAGGAIVACLNQRPTTDYEIWAGRIYSTGVVPWNKSFCSVADLPLLDDLFDIVSDGANGAIITWQDFRGGTYFDIYAQRVSSAGAALWTANGNAVCTATSDQKYPKICNTSSSGAIITWQDWRGSTWDIYAQKINSTGYMKWIADGAAICTAVNDQKTPQICSDGANGAIIAWNDKRGGSWDHVYTQRIDSSGNVQWITDGAAMCTAPNPKYLSKPCSDGAQGAFIPYQYYSPTGDDVYVQRAYLALPETPILDPITPNPTSSTSVVLNWNQCVNATKYYLFKSTSEINTIAGIIPLVFNGASIHTYTDVNWVNGTYYYAIIAGGILLNSSLSNCENVTVEFTSGGPRIPAFELGFVFLGLSLLVLVGIRKRSSLKF